MYNNAITLFNITLVFKNNFIPVCYTNIIMYVVSYVQKITHDFLNYCVLLLKSNHIISVIFQHYFVAVCSLRFIVDKIYILNLQKNNLFPCVIKLN